MYSVEGECRVTLCKEIGICLIPGHFTFCTVSKYLLRTNCILFYYYKSNRKAMNRNWSNQKANPALKTKAGNK